MHQPAVESPPTTSIKSLKSRFEQFALAQDNTNVITSSTPSPPAEKPLSTSSSNSPQPRSRQRVNQGKDDHSAFTASSPRLLRNASSNSDLSPGLKRAPPPPPPSRSAKKPGPSSSPITSPLLRPVPVPVAFRSPRASPECSPVSRLQHDTEDDVSRGGGVASLRERFASAVSSPPRHAPKPAPRISHLMTQSEPNIDVLESTPPVLSRSNPKPTSRILLFSQSQSSPIPEDTLSDEFFDSQDNPIDQSPPMGGVASLRSRFSTLIHPSPQSTPKPLSRNEHLTSHSEPNILAPSPPMNLRRHPPPPPPTNPCSALFDKDEDSLEPRGGLNSSSRHSPFSDDESEISEMSLPPAIPPRAPRVSVSEHSYSDDICSSSESICGMSSPRPKPKRSSGPCLTVPPRPPPRRNSSSNGNGSGNFQNSRDSSASSTPTLHSPPPLPSRRPTPEDFPDVTSPPSHLTRHGLNISSCSSNDLTMSPVDRKKPIGSGKLPPPPTRTIAPGDKLPPARRAHTPSSDEESGADDACDDPRMLLPDASHASRRPPKLRAPRIHVPAYSAQVVVAGARVLVAAHHHLRCYDLGGSGGDNVPIWLGDTKDMGVRDAKVTALEFRAGSGGSVVWAGTKEGHLIELDMASGEVIGTKFGAHAGIVTHIFRYGNKMVSVDESGKVLVFEPTGGVSASSSPSGSQQFPNLGHTAPRAYRIADKSEFVKMLGGFLWASVRGDTNGTGHGAVPIVRIYDVFAPGSIGRAANVLPSSTQHVGPVTCGTLLPSHARYAYLGHEGGFVSIWNLVGAGGGPECTDVVKVSSSDVLSLEGVGDRLWAGGRTGVISAYDVMSRPWVVTNAWNAHAGLPVMRIFVDPWGIEKEERLSVLSVGRDDQIRFWDGLLAVDWIGNELLKRERAFSSFRTLNVLVVSWNVDAAKPESLTDDPANVFLLHDALTSVSNAPDIISFGFQEMIDLESRKMAAKTVLLGGKKKGEEGKISEKVSSSYKRWHDRLVREVRALSDAYTVVYTESLVGLFTCIFVKNSERAALKDVAITTIKRGMGGRYGNKGGIVARFVIDDSSVCFINCHLAAGQQHVRQRNADVTAMLEEKSVFPSSSDMIEESLAYVGGGDGSMVLDHEIVFLNGDLNYRIDQRREVVISAIQSNDFETLHVHDQLLKEMKHNRGFRLRFFEEGPLNFAPTYKYDRRTCEFDTSEKKRVPAWCDRVLWRCREPERVRQVHYRRYEANVSDHRPVSAGFEMVVKRVRVDGWMKEKGVVWKEWMGVQVGMLEHAREFYVEQALLL